MKIQIVPAEESESSVVLDTRTKLRADRNPCAVYLMSLTEGQSRDSTRRALMMFLRAMIPVPPGMTEMADRLKWRSKLPVDISAFPWWKLRREHFQAVRAVLSVEKSITSANKLIIAARGVLREARELELISRDDFEKIERVKRVGGKKLLSGRAFPPEEIRQIYSSCDYTTPVGVRNATVFYLAWAGGARREEMSNLDLESINFGTRTMLVKGKGNKEREVPLSEETCQALQRWLAVRGTDPGPLFYASTRKGQLINGRRISAQTIYDLLSALGKRAGVQNTSPHNFRRTFITDSLDSSGGDVLSVASLAGHADPKTTSLYDRRGEKAKRKMVDERGMK